MGIGGKDWSRELNSTSIFFHHMGDLKIKKGTFKVAKVINISLIEEQIIMVKKEVLDFAHNNVIPQDEWDLIERKKYILEVTKLDMEWRSIRSLLGNYRKSRSINFIGSGLKSLFGTMDNDDEIHINEVLQDIGNRQDRLHSTVNKTVYLMTNLTKQWELLSGNQLEQMSNLLTLKNMVIDNYSIVQRKLDKRYFESHLDNLILAVQVQIEKLSNAILFLKAGIVDPYFVDVDEFLKAFSQGSLGFQATEADIEIIMSKLKPISFYDVNSHLIHIIFLFPIADSGVVYKLYENFIIPKQYNSKVIILKDIPRYLAISGDKGKFFSAESIDCFEFSQLFVCERKPIINLNVSDSCITDLFLFGNDSKCEYKGLRQSFDVHNVVNKGLIVFSDVGLSIQLNCGNIQEVKTFQGSVFIQPPENCSVNSTHFEFSRYNFNKEIVLDNVIPTITCCSSYFKIWNSTYNQSSSLVFKSLHDIKTIDDVDLKSELKYWDTFRMEDYVGEDYWNIKWIAMIIIGLIGIFIIMKLYMGRDNRKGNMVNVNSTYITERPEAVSIF